MSSQRRAVSLALRRGRRAAPGYLGHGDLSSSLLYVVPLFLAYELGVIFSPTVNGVDFVTRAMLAAVGNDRVHYLLAHLGLAAAFSVVLVYLRRRRAVPAPTLAALVIESAIYALTLGSFIVLVMEKLLGFSGLLAVPGVIELPAAGQAIITSLGAGVHEELVFRLGLMGGGAALLGGVLGLSRPLAVVLAMVGSSLLFSAVHHLGPLGDPFDLQVFTYRALAGAIFGTIFYFRSLAHAVYTHALYDIYVLILRGG